MPPPAPPVTLVPCPSQRIEDSVVKLISMAGIDGIDTDDVNIFRREAPERIDQDPSPCVIVVVGKERMPSLATHERQTNVTWIFEYPVLVIYSVKGALVLWKSDPRIKEARYTLRNTLYRDFLPWSADWAPDSAVPVTRRCVYNPTPVVNTVGFQRDMKISTQEFIYRVEENRAT